MYIYIVYKYIYLDDVCLCILRHANIRHLNMYKDTQNIWCTSSKCTHNLSKDTKTREDDMAYSYIYVIIWIYGIYMLKCTYNASSDNTYWNTVYCHIYRHVIFIDIYTCVIQVYVYTSQSSTRTCMLSTCTTSQIRHLDLTNSASYLHIINSPSRLRARHLKYEVIQTSQTPRVDYIYGI